MAFGICFGVLIICLSGSIKIARAGWDDPPFLQPEPLDDAIPYFEYNELLTSANIILNEEVNYDVCIAVLNYKDEARPALGPLGDGKSNFMLGAVIKRNSSTNMWALWITKKQDYETPIMREYRFDIIIGMEAYSIALNIKNIDDNPPVIQLVGDRCMIEENYVGPNCSFVVSDADGSIEHVSITLTSNPESKSFKFVTQPVTGAEAKYKLTAFLDVTESLDFETVSMYMLLIEATDPGNKTTFNTVIEVIDKPDEPPVWTQITAVENIVEKTRKIFPVAAIDGDLHIKAEISYKIEVDKDDEKYFTIDSKTGEITVNPINRDALQRDVFRFLVIAYETLAPESKINATIIVIVEDVNDNVPEITPTDLSIEIKEETYTTLEFKSPIVIKDLDLAENGQFSVSLIDKSEYKWSSAFLVVPTSGYQSGIFTISVANATLLDYEDENWRIIDMQLRAIEVANTSHVGIRNIKVRLKDWNDELPIFDKSTPSNVSVPEDVGENFSIAVVKATDRDADDKVTYSLMGQQSFKIDAESGEITTTQSNAFNYESTPVVILQIVATDQADHKIYTTLTINVIDVNDVPPELHLPRQSPTLEEEVTISTPVEALINATDIDTEAELTFDIDWENTRAAKKSVEVDEDYYRGRLEIKTNYPKEHKRYAEGTLVVTDRIDYEKFDVIFLSISVIDSKTKLNSNTTYGSMTLYIKDINDNSPIFEPIANMSVEENQKTNVLIGSVMAKDEDDPPFNNISYFIQPIKGTKEKLLFINQVTGVIRVDESNATDAEEYEYLYYNLIATDGQTNTTKEIAIYVIDKNDNVPYLLTDKFNSTIRIREKATNGTPIVRIQANDNDRTSPFNNVSYLLNANYPATFQYFSVGKFDGLIQVDLTDGYILDRDHGSSEFILNLKLRDNFLDNAVILNTNSIDEVVTVILIDINDQKPQLPDRGKPAASCTENTKKDELILTIEAKDDDEPDTINTKVFYEIKSIVSADKENESLDENVKIPFYVVTRDHSKADIFANFHLKGYYGKWAVTLYVQDLGTDPGPLNDTRTYVIDVTDFNSDIPQIKFPDDKIIALAMDQTLHAPLITYDDQQLNNFLAIDKDHGASGIVIFSLSSTTGDHEYFEIEPISTNVGQLRLTKIIDVDKQSSYTMTLHAADRGDPSFESSKDFTVIFVTKTGPKFDTPEWTVWIKENTTSVGKGVMIPEAHDMVSEANENIVTIYYFMTDVEDAKYFALDEQTRNLTVEKELDREKQDIMRLNVIATTNQNGPPGNPMDHSILKITVIVVDENDNPPIFEKPIYRGGVAMEDPLDKNILTVKATDADINETLTYSIVSNSMTTSDVSLSSTPNPFSIDSSSGDLALRFTVTSNMNGYFKFDVMAQDKDMKHNTKIEVQVYVVLQKNRVVFTFSNVASYVKEMKMFLIDAFTNAFDYLCNVDDIKSAVDANDQVLDNMTTVMTHFIESETNLPIDTDVIIVSSNDLRIISDLKAILLTKSLYLSDVPTGSSTSTDNTQEIIHWTLVSLTTIFSVCTVALLVIYILRTRSLKGTLDKLAITKYGSQESGLDQAGVVPTTNQFAMAGSNPMWLTTKQPTDDNTSQVSGDSDLIGIEDNPHFGYINNAMVKDDKWGTVSPIFATPQNNLGNRTVGPSSSGA